MEVTEADMQMFSVGDDEQAARSAEREEAKESEGKESEDADNNFKSV